MEQFFVDQLLPADLGLLDNPVWSAIKVSQSQHALTRPLAVRFLPEYTPFVTKFNDTELAEQNLLDLVDTNETVYLFSPHAVVSPNRWFIDAKVNVHQMICLHATSLESPDFENSDIEIIHPSKENVLQLTKIAFPDFFRKKTYEMGRYWGLKYQGQLATIAGERMKIAPHFQEISTVCTLPEFKRCGFSKILMSKIVTDLQQKNLIPYAHIVHTNQASLNLFSKLGFTIRATIPMLKLRKK